MKQLKLLIASQLYYLRAPEEKNSEIFSGFKMVGARQMGNFSDFNIYCMTCSTIGGILLFLVACAVCGQTGWIIQHAIQSQKEILQLSPLGNRSVIVQDNQNIYQAFFSSPNNVSQKIIIGQHQQILFANSWYNNSYLYYVPPFIHYEYSNSFQFLNLGSVEYSNNIIKIDNLIFFCNFQTSSHLLVYNTTSGKVYNGPYLDDFEQQIYSTTFEVSNHTEHFNLLLGIHSKLFIIDLKTLTISQKIQTQLAHNMHSIEVSASGVYIAAIEDTMVKIFAFDSVEKIYKSIYSSNLNMDGVNTYIGLSFDEKEQSCQEMSMDYYDPTAYKRKISKFDCSQSYDTIIFNIGASIDNLVNIHAVGNDFKTIYTITFIKQQINVLTYQILDNSLNLTKNASFPISGVSSVDYFLASENQILAIKLNTATFLLLWSSQRGSFICEDQIVRNIHFVQYMKHLIFNPLENQIYFSTEVEGHRFVWINLQTCQFQDLVFDGIILNIMFLNSKIYLQKSGKDGNLLVLDENTKQKINLYRINTTNNIAFKDHIYGFFNENSLFKIGRLSNDDMQIDLQNQIPCNQQSRILKSGANHISVICNNQYHLYSSTLQYLGSSIIHHYYIDSIVIDETYSPQIRFDRYTGQLHKNIFKIWENKVDTIGTEVYISSNYYMLNQTEAIYLTRKNRQYYLNRGKYGLLQFTSIQQMLLRINSSQNILIANTPMRWSCNKKYILFQYVSRLDNFNTYINVYEPINLKLIYSHRISNEISGLQQKQRQFVAYVDCDNNLLIARNHGVQLIHIDKRSTLTPQNISSVTRISLSSQGNTALIYGNLQNKAKSIELWDLEKQELKQAYFYPPFDALAKLYSIGSSVFGLDKNNLFKIGKVNTSIIETLIKDCTYLNNLTIICLFLNKTILIINEQRQYLQEIPYQLQNADNIFVSPSENLLIVYNQSSLSIFDIYPESFILSQQIDFKEKMIDQIVVSGDSHDIMIYDKQANFFTLLSRGTCFGLANLKNGICECVAQQTDDECRCRQGWFQQNDACSQCTFYCQTCSGSANNCSSLTSTAIALIVCIAVLALALLGLIYRCVKKCQRKSAKMEAMSQLLEQKSSIAE